MSVQIAPSELNEVRDQAFALFSAGIGLKAVAGAVDRPMALVARWRKAWMAQHQTDSDAVTALLEGVYSEEIVALTEKTAEGAHAVLDTIIDSVDIQADGSRRMKMSSLAASQYATAAQKLLKTFSELTGHDVRRSEAGHMVLNIDLPTQEPVRAKVIEMQSPQEEGDHSIDV